MQKNLIKHNFLNNKNLFNCLSIIILKINTMNSKNIFPVSYLFAFLNGFTILLIYAKEEGDFYIGWFTSFAPTFIYFLIKLF